MISTTMQIIIWGLQCHQGLVMFTITLVAQNSAATSSSIVMTEVDVTVHCTINSSEKTSMLAALQSSF